MAVLKKIRARWWPTAGNSNGGLPENGVRREAPAEQRFAAVATAPDFAVDEMTIRHLDECWRLDHRCFVDGEAYSRDTIEYLLTSPDAICFRAFTRTNQMIAFVIGLVEPDRTGHVTTVCVAPEHRRRGVALRLMEHAEESFRRRHVRTIRLEVRSTNDGARLLYEGLGYAVLQVLPQYYSNGGDGLLMIKSIDGQEASASRKH